MKEKQERKISRETDKEGCGTRDKKMKSKDTVGNRGGTDQLTSNVTKYAYTTCVYVGERTLQFCASVCVHLYYARV